ncbi:MAG: hypothetical protein AAF658_11525 [Myxococcota bacterium]
MTSPIGERLVDKGLARTELQTKSESVEVEGEQSTRGVAGAHVEVSGQVRGDFDTQTALVTSSRKLDFAEMLGMPAASGTGYASGSDAVEVGAKVKTRVKAQVSADAAANVVGQVRQTENKSTVTKTES